MYLDKKLSNEYLAGNEELFQIVGNSFKDSYKDFEERLKKTLDEGDLDKTYNEIHSLKGITLNLGLKQLYDSCVLVLKELKEKRIDTTNINSLVNVFNLSYNELITFLN